MTGSNLTRPPALPELVEARLADLPDDYRKLTASDLGAIITSREVVLRAMAEALDEMSSVADRLRGRNISEIAPSEWRRLCDANDRYEEAALAAALIDNYVDETGLDEFLLGVVEP